MLDGKQFSRASEAGGDLVINHEDAVLVAELPQLPQVFRRIDAHARRALQDRLHDDRRRFLSELFEGRLGTLEAFARAGVARLVIGTAEAVSPSKWMLCIIMGW